MILAPIGRDRLRVGDEPVQRQHHAAVTARLRRAAVAGNKPANMRPGLSRVEEPPDGTVPMTVDQRPGWSGRDGGLTDSSTRARGAAGARSTTADGEQRGCRRRVLAARTEPWGLR